MNKIIALIGEAGSGKDFIAKKLIEQDPVSFCPIISCTTRPKRSHETNGVDYFFLTNEEFQNKVIKGQMLEYTSFNNWFYGTAYDSLTKDKINVGVFNPAGIKYLSRYSDIDLVVFRLVTSKKTRLLRQLRREEDPDVDEIVRRYVADQLDFLDCNLDFNYTPIINEKYEDIPNILKEIQDKIN